MRDLALSEPVLAAETAAPWEQALAHAVAANVAAARGEAARHRSRYDEARRLTAALPEPEDRAILEATLRTLPPPTA